MSRPVLYVLAGVNGAGKSSIGGHLLTRAGLAWFNPDTFARELVTATGCDPTAANAAAWTEGMRRLAPTPEARAAVEQAVPLRRFAQISEIAEAALFLCSPAAEYITGVVLPVDGGSGLSGGRFLGQ